MGLFTPKYAKSDTSGATGTPPTRKERREAALCPPDRGVTADQLRGLALHEGGKVEKRGKYMVVRVEKPGLYGPDFSSERYVQRSDGKWVAG